MAHVLRPTFTVPVPDGATIIHQPHTFKGQQHDAWPFIELVQDGRKVRFPLTADGTKYLKPSDVWHAEYRTPDGKRVRKKGSADKKVTQQLAARLEREAMLQAEGLADPFTVHKKRPLVEHLEDFTAALTAKGNTADYVRLTTARIRAVLDGCRFTTFADLSASVFVEWLAAQRERGLSVATSNYHLVAMKGFFGWMVRDRRLSESPFNHLQRMNAKVDVRRERRDLQPEEVLRLVQAAHEGKPFRGLTGEDRAMLYLVALGTGFRMAELASLTPAAFNLEGNPPTITLEAAYSKRRREDVQPLRRDLADVLRPWLEGKDAKRPVWPGSWQVKKSAVMIRVDLASARAKWLDEVKNNPDELQRRKVSGFLQYDNDDGTADFHALRHTFISGLARGGVHPKLAQALARHSTITLTMDRYSHVGLDDAKKALESLSPVRTSCTNLVPSAFSGMQFPALVCSNDESDEEEGEMKEPPDLQGVTAECSDMQQTRTTGLEPATTGSTVRSPFQCNSLTSKPLTETGHGGLVPTLYRAADHVPLPPDLQTLAALWPDLPDVTRQALLRLASPDLPEPIRLAVFALLNTHAPR